MILLKKYQLIFFVTLNFIILLSHGQLQFFLEEVRSLSELPMSKLIKIKSNFAGSDDQALAEVNEEVEGRMAMVMPMAMPLKRIDNKSIRRHSDYWEEKGHDSKISKIFQLTITTLSFFAFGGYLLTLVITAIKRNSLANGSNVIVLSNIQKYTRPKRHAFIYDPMENEFDVDKMYRGMIMLSEEYTSYNKLK